MYKALLKAYNVVAKANMIALGGLQPIQDTLFVVTTAVGVAKKMKEEKEKEFTVEYEVKDA